MWKIRNPFYWVETPREIILVVCYRCSKNFGIHINNVRVYNYCSNCK